RSARWLTSNTKGTSSSPRTRIEIVEKLATIEQAIRGHCMAADVARIPHGLRIQTLFQYPDGSLIDLYAVDGEPVLPDSGLRRTDFGETVWWVSIAQIRPARSKKRMMFLEDGLARVGAALDGGELTSITHADRVGMDVIALGQACVRAS